MKNNCPYLEKGQICTHIVPGCKKLKRRRFCPYKSPDRCPLLKDTKSIAIAPVIEPGVYHRIEVEK